MQPDPARVAETREWLAKAALDLRGARIDLEAAPPLLEDTLFHEGLRCLADAQPRGARGGLRGHRCGPPQRDRPGGPSDGVRVGLPLPRGSSDADDRGGPPGPRHDGAHGGGGGGSAPVRSRAARSARPDSLTCGFEKPVAWGANPPANRLPWAGVPARDGALDMVSGCPVEGGAGDRHSNPARGDPAGPAGRRPSERRDSPSQARRRGRT